MLSSVSKNPARAAVPAYFIFVCFFVASAAGGRVNVGCYLFKAGRVPSLLITK